MKQAMKKMGMKQEDVDASAVVIHLHGEKMVFDNPSVQKIEMMGQVSFQISGEYTVDSSASQTISIDQDSVETVMGQAGCTREAALEALEKSKGDIAEAILSISDSREE
ncbi:MAG: nascent polypeptide-associated complex protein [Candidatus Woesearchaeota archaeon]